MEEISGGMGLVAANVQRNFSHQAPQASSIANKNSLSEQQQYKINRLNNTIFKQTNEP